MILLMKMSKHLVVNELSNCLSHPSRPRPFCSNTNAISSLASPHIPQASSLPCRLGHCEPCSCVCPSPRGLGGRYFWRQIPKTAVFYGVHIANDTSGTGNMGRTHGPGLWEAVPGRLVYHPQIDIYHSEAGNLVSGLIFMCCLCWPLSSE